MDDILGRVYLSYLFVIKGIRNEIEHPEIVELESKNIIGNTLDTMRIFLEGIVKIINSYRRGVNTILLPRFEYSIIQPDDNEAKIIPTQKIKSKSRDYITIQKAPFNIEGMDIQLTKENISEIFSQFSYFKKGEKVLAVKTFGDIFTINKDLTGYTGDWQVNEEVDKLIVLHFYDGPESTTAAVYVGNYVSREERTEYRVEEVGKERHRYSYV